jgi:hypothetical protein
MASIAPATEHGASPLESLRTPLAPADKDDERKEPEGRKKLVPIWYRLRSTDESEPRDPWLADESQHFLFRAPYFPAFIKFPGWTVIFIVLLAGVIVELLCTVFAHDMATLLDEPSEWHAIRRLLGRLSIPVCSVAFTYGHIWLALWMMFYPTDYIVRRLSSRSFRPYLCDEGACGSRRACTGLLPAEAVRELRARLAGYPALQVHGRHRTHRRHDQQAVPTRSGSNPVQAIP